jgi:murein DD-endopeptidase MepM/ murein hydrolase activator NlpD
MVTASDEFSSRTLLSALITQAGASSFEFPELTRLLNPSSSLPLQVIIAERVSMMKALPTMAPAEGWLASGFGERIDPMSKRKTEHRGLDISNNPGTVIRAPADGIVRFAGKYGQFGVYLSLVHGYGVVTKYGHLKEVLVKPGQPVKRGDIVARMGSSGKSTGTHVHYEIWINDKAFNPYAFMPKAMLPGTTVTTPNDNLPARQVVELATRH